MPLQRDDPKDRHWGGRTCKNANNNNNFTSGTCRLTTRSLHSVVLHMSLVGGLHFLCSVAQEWTRNPVCPNHGSRGSTRPPVPYLDCPNNPPYLYCRYSNISLSEAGTAAKVAGTIFAVQHSAQRPYMRPAHHPIISYPC